MVITINSKITTPADCHPYGIEHITESIKTGICAHTNKDIRPLIKDIREGKEELKKTLPVFIFTGLYSERNNKSLQKLSGLASFDLDQFKTAEQVEEVKQQLKDNPFVYCAFISPRGMGLKVIIRIREVQNESDYKDLFDQFAKFMEWEESPLFKYDRLNDLCRACFMSYDPDLYINTDAIVFDGWEVEQKETLVIDRGYNVTPWDALNDEFNINLFNNIAQHFGYYPLNKKRGGLELYKRDGGENEYQAKLNIKPNGRASFQVFSGGQYLEQKTYTYFELYALKNNNGDFKQAGKDLFTQGYGTKKTEQVTRPIEKEETRAAFPLHVFPEFVQNTFMEYNKAENFNVDFMAAAFITMTGTIIGNSHKIQLTGSWRESSIFWFLALGKPGTMKTPPIKEMLKPLQQVDSQQFKEYQREFADWDKEEKKTTAAPLCNQTIINDATIEALHQAHTINQNGLLLYKDELMGWVKSMDSYKSNGGGERENWLESFGNGKLKKNRVGAGVSMIDNTHINIIGTIQPQVIKKLLSDGSGFLDRFLFTQAEETVAPMTDSILNTDLINDYREAMRQMYGVIKQDPETRIIELQPEQQKTFRHYQNKLIQQQNSPETNNKEMELLSKIRTYHGRFVLLLYMLDAVFNSYDGHPTDDHVKNAFDLTSYFYNNALKFYKDADKSKAIDKIVDKMKHSSKEELIKEMLIKGHKNKDIAENLVVSAQYVSKIKRKMKK